MITTERFNYSGKYNKDFVIACASNGDGKSELLMRMVCHGVDKSKIFVLNTSRQKSWEQFVPAQNVFIPLSFSQEFIEKFLLQFMATHSDCMLILDDVDAYKNFKSSDVVYSVVREARHSGVGLVVATGLMQKLPTIYFSQASYIFVGPQHSFYNILYLSRIDIPREDCESFRELQQYTFAAWVAKTKLMYHIRLKLEAFK